MSNFNFADCRKAVNQATFRPTADRKAAATKLLQEALDFIANLEEVKETSKKSTKRRRKTTKSKKATPQQRVADRQEKAFHGKADSPIKPSKKAKTASVKEAAASAKAVSEATGAAQRAAKRAELKAKALKKEAEASETPKVTAKKPSKRAKVYKSNGQPNQVELDKRFAALDEKLNSMLAVIALQMQGEPTQVETVSFDELPFEL